MITGTVDEDQQAIIRLIVRGPDGQEQSIVGIIDTGYTGSLALPPGFVAELHLPFRRRGHAILADRTSIVVDVHEAAVLWDDVWRQVAIDVIDADPLIGTGLLIGHELSVQFVTGGDVRISPIESSTR